MKQRLTKEDVQVLSSEAQARLIALWEASSFYPIRDDTQVAVYIPEEEGNEDYGPVYTGNWDKECEFTYPGGYIGKLKNHRGTIIPLLTVGEMIELLSKQDNDDLAFRLYLLTHGSPGNAWSFDTDALPTTLWEGLKTVLQRQDKAGRPDGT